MLNNLVVVDNTVTYGSNLNPNEGKGFEFVDAIVGGSVPREYINSVKVGLEDALATGMIAGYPVLEC